MISSEAFIVEAVQYDTKRHTCIIGSVGSSGTLYHDQSQQYLLLNKRSGIPAGFTGTISFTATASKSGKSYVVRQATVVEDWTDKAVTRTEPTITHDDRRVKVAGELYYIPAPKVEVCKYYFAIGGRYEFDGMPYSQSGTAQEVKPEDDQWVELTADFTPEQQAQARLYWKLHDLKYQVQSIVRETRKVGSDVTYTTEWDKEEQNFFLCTYCRPIIERKTVKVVVNLEALTAEVLEGWSEPHIAPYYFDASTSQSRGKAEWERVKRIPLRYTVEKEPLPRRIVRNCIDIKQTGVSANVDHWGRREDGPKRVYDFDGFSIPFLFTEVLEYRRYELPFIVQQLNQKLQLIAQHPNRDLSNWKGEGEDFPSFQASVFERRLSYQSFIDRKYPLTQLKGIRIPAAGWFVVEQEHRRFSKNENWAEFLPDFQVETEMLALKPVSPLTNRATLIYWADDLYASFTDLPGFAYQYPELVPSVEQPAETVATVAEEVNNVSSSTTNATVAEETTEEEPNTPIGPPDISVLKKNWGIE